MNIFKEIYFDEGHLVISDEGRSFLMKNAFLWFIVLIFALKIYNVAEVGPDSAQIGLSKVNIWFRNLWHYDKELGYSPFWYAFTKVLGWVYLAVCAFWAGLFVRDMVLSGGFDGVGTDKNLAATFFLYVLAAIALVIFHYLVVNYSPVLVSGKTKPSPSFPSFHVLLSVLAWGSTAFHIAEIFDEKKKPRRILIALCIAAVLAGIFASALCGIYWLTDIIGAILLGLTLLFVYSFFFYI